MKIELSTRKGDVVVDLSTETERHTFANSLPNFITPKQFISAVMIEDDGDAKFSTLHGFMTALRNYED